jgi:hypothetical protein
MLLLYRCSLAARAWLAELLSVLRGALGLRTALSPITAAWVDDMLRGAGHAGGTVAAVDVTTLSDNRGFVGVMRKVRITYRDPVAAAQAGAAASGAPSRAPPSSLIVKTSKGGYQGRMYQLTTNHVREAQWYAQTQRTGSSHTPSPAKFSMPTLVYAYWSYLFAEYIIVMEDVTSAPTQDGDVVGVNMVMGNQVWGIDPTVKEKINASKVTELAVLRAMFALCADMHAAYWKSPSLFASNFRAAGWYQGKK